MVTNDAVIVADCTPALCGTTKFGVQLAERLGVPLATMEAAGRYQCPLVSVRWLEVAHRSHCLQEPFDLFLHDTHTPSVIVKKARRVFAANCDIADSIRPYREDVVTLWAPATIRGNAHRGNLRLLTFGMAHKLQLDKYQALKEALDKTGKDYTISLSTAVHDGMPWESLVTAGDELEAIFGHRLRRLGFLFDDAIVREFQGCEAVVLFFDPALRENNTTFWSAYDAGCDVVTNMDERSPSLHSGQWLGFDRVHHPANATTRLTMDDLCAALR